MCITKVRVIFFPCRYGLTQPLRSPEAFFNYGGSWPVKPINFDTWSLGILIIEVFTGSYLSKKLPQKVCTWTKQVYPVIHDVLKVRVSYYYYE